jgi:hypothetical protein
MDTQFSLPYSIVKRIFLSNKFNQQRSWKIERRVIEPQVVVSSNIFMNFCCYFLDTFNAIMQN